MTFGIGLLRGVGGEPVIDLDLEKRGFSASPPKTLGSFHQRCAGHRRFREDRASASVS